MIARLSAAALLAAAAISLAGCSVGRFIAGAPAPDGARAVAASPAPAGGRTAPVILKRRCGGCHEVPEPASMTAAEWQAGLELMKKRMRLPQAEWDSLAGLGRMSVPD